MEIIFDKSGFPMVKVIPENFWIHLWPITKIQFEFFLCDRPSSTMDANWYDRVLANNPRITPERVTSKNYWRLFVTGVHPKDELPTFSEWNGSNYSIPTEKEWMSAYRYFSDQDAVVNLKTTLEKSGADKKMDALVPVIAQKLELVLQNRKNGELRFSDQLLMRKGIMEWVRLLGGSSEWGGLGVPDSASGWSTSASVLQGRPEVVRVLSIGHYGSRLVRRA